MKTALSNLLKQIQLMYLGPMSLRASTKLRKIAGIQAFDVPCELTSAQMASKFLMAGKGAD